MKIELNIRNLIRLIVLTPLVIYVLYCSYYFLTHEMNPQYLDCGIVQSKGSDEVAIKHGSKTDLYLNVQFEKSGFQSINCEPSTYFQYKVGDRVCFNVNTETTTHHQLTMIFGAIIIGFTGFVMAMFLLKYLIG